MFSPTSVPSDNLSVLKWVALCKSAEVQSVMDDLESIMVLLGYRYPEETVRFNISRAYDRGKPYTGEYPELCAFERYAIATHLSIERLSDGPLIGENKELLSFYQEFNRLSKKTKGTS